MTYDVEINQLGLMALFDLKGHRDAMANWCGAAIPAFPEPALCYSAENDMELMSLGRDNWMLRAPVANEDALLGALKPDAAPTEISVVRVSDAFSFFSVTGSEAAEVMAVATPLDIHPDVFPENGAAFTEVFSTRGLILRVDSGFHIGVERSYAPMIADYLARTIAA